MPQGLKGVTSKPASEIGFSSAKAKKDKLDKASVDDTAAMPAFSSQKPLPVVNVPDTNVLMNDLFSKLKLTNSEYRVLNVLPAYCENYKVN